MEDIEDIDYRHGNNVFNKFQLNNLGDYHDLYVQSDTLLLADVFENLRDTCLKEYELDPEKTKNPEMRSNFQQIVVYCLGLHTENPGLREVDLEPSPKRGSDKINMHKQGRNT